MFVHCFRITHSTAMRSFRFLCLSLVIINAGVFGVETKEVSVTEGDVVTLHTGVEKQKDDLIVWYFGPDKTLVAQINGKASLSICDVAGGELDTQTGSLIISDVKTTQSGLYTLRISSNKRVSYKTFRVTVYAHLPVPVIIRKASSCSSSSEGSSLSKCALLCSVVDVSHVTLSWYKGNSLISSISVSDLSISVSLPLEVENEDRNTYSCVLNNTISLQTTHLDISGLCQPCADTHPPVLLILVICAVILILVIITALVIIKWFIIRRRRIYQKTNLEESSDADTMNPDL